MGGYKRNVITQRPELAYEYKAMGSLSLSLSLSLSFQFTMELHGATAAEWRHFKFSFM
jgi:hypothetical protein